MIDGQRTKRNGRETETIIRAETMLSFHGWDGGAGSGGESNNQVGKGDYGFRERKVEEEASREKGKGRKREWKRREGKEREGKGRERKESEDTRIKSSINYLTTLCIYLLFYVVYLVWLYCT